MTHQTTAVGQSVGGKCEAQPMRFRVMPLCSKKYIHVFIRESLCVRLLPQFLNVTIVVLFNEKVSIYMIQC